MKKIALLLIIAGVLPGCDGGEEKKAQIRLEAAQHALSMGNFNEAKLQIDSIKILHPKAFETRKKSMDLLLEVEYKEQVKTMAYLDSMLQVSEEKFEELKGNFVLEKDPEYQDIGIYFYPSQVLEKNINRSFLRAQVNEKGTMYLTSVYCGSYPIRHKAVKITAPDGSFAETPVSQDIYETTDLGVVTEKADYKLGSDGDAIGFITLNQDQQLRAEYLHGKKYTTTLSAADKKAIAEIHNFALVLSSIEDIKKEQKEASRKMEFLRRKIAEKDTNLAAE